MFGARELSVTSPREKWLARPLELRNLGADESDAISMSGKGRKESSKRIRGDLHNVQRRTKSCETAGESYLSLCVSLPRESDRGRAQENFQGLISAWKQRHSKQVSLWLDLKDCQATNTRRYKTSKPHP